jgi:hypothetical protein
LDISAHTENRRNYDDKVKDVGFASEVGVFIDKAQSIANRFGGDFECKYYGCAKINVPE